VVRRTVPARRFAINIPPFTDAGTVVDIAVEAETAGWDGVFLWDHLQWIPDQLIDVHNPWVLLGAIARCTARVRVGTLVTPLSRRRPWQVAKELITLDHLSAGRAVLGVGLGETPESDFAAFGEPDGTRDRAVLLDEGLEVLDGLLRGDHVAHRGLHFRVDTRVSPRPLQEPRPPIWVAGIVPNQPPLRRAVRYNGIVPIGRELLLPDQLAAYIGPHLRPEWDVVSPWAPGVPAEEYADAGATWLVESTEPLGDWVPEFRQRVNAGPVLR
jgi:alkanesulfonate monooxygenase SsuD/methylene tetrahydromethanopterin reductase-like flavin-dependent oxidoreductase (luciferase family)